MFECKIAYTIYIHCNSAHHSANDSNTLFTPLL